MGSLKFVLAILAIAMLAEKVNGHGMMLDPPNRSSLWRFDESAKPNYEDDENFCGGYGIQWNVHQGKCGVCGDSYGDAIPRDNENTGTYGEGKVVAEYQSGSVVNVSILLTTNHDGWFNYSLCVLKDSSKPETDECFQTLLFEDGRDQVKISPTQNNFNDFVRLPAGLTCERCVLRWTYKAANMWGICEDGSGSMGCGPQEVYRSCADIAIV